MSYEIKIGQKSIVLDCYVEAVNAPNVRMAAMFKGMVDAVSDLRVAALAAESEAAKLERIRSNPDFTDTAKARRRKETVDPDTLKGFRKGLAAANAQAANILDYLKRELHPVEVLKSDDVQGFLRDAELRKVFRGLESVSRQRLINAMHRGEQTDLCDAILRANPLCSGMTDEQCGRLGLSRISSDNTPVVQAVSDLVIAARKDLRQTATVRTWYSNLVFGVDEKPENTYPAVPGLDALGDYAGMMLKINQRQGSASPEDNDIQKPVDPEEEALAAWRAKWEAAQLDDTETA